MLRHICLAMAILFALVITLAFASCTAKQLPTGMLIGENGLVIAGGVTADQTNFVLYSSQNVEREIGCYAALVVGEEAQLVWVSSSSSGSGSCYSGEIKKSMGQARLLGDIATAVKNSHEPLVESGKLTWKTAGIHHVGSVDEAIAFLTKEDETGLMFDGSWTSNQLKNLGYIKDGGADRLQLAEFVYGQDPEGTSLYMSEWPSQLILPDGRMICRLKSCPGDVVCVGSVSLQGTHPQWDVYLEPGCLNIRYGYPWLMNYKLMGAIPAWYQEEQNPTLKRDNEVTVLFGGIGYNGVVKNMTVWSDGSHCVAIKMTSLPEKVVNQSVTFSGKSAKVIALTQEQGGQTITAKLLK